MAVQGDPFGPFYEKLQLPHPLIQRYAVNGIFERLKSGPSHISLKSPAGQEAFARCLTSTQPAVIDQTVKEICRACAEGVVAVEKGLQDLQAALDSVNSESVASVMNGIGFLCRIYLQNVEAGTVCKGRSGDLLSVGFHPLVKSFQTRTEEHQHILRQVGILLRNDSPKQQTTVVEFLQPFITYILLQPSNSPRHVLFARELHSQLSFLSYEFHGQVLLKMLISYIQHYPTETAQEREVAMGSTKELVDVWECLLKQRRIQHFEEELMQLGSQLFCMLIGFCHELLLHKASLYHTLVLVKRMIDSLQLLSPSVPDSVGVSMVSLAHMLGMVDAEQEQLLLLDLGLSWLEYICARGKKWDMVLMTAAPLLLVWIFPALHVMSYPSVPVKGAAMRLLQVLERAVGETKTHKTNVGTLKVNSIGREMGSCGEQQLAVVMCRLLHFMWSEEEAAVKWVSGLTAGTITVTTSAENWLNGLTAYLTKSSQFSKSVNATTQSLRLSKGLLVLLCTLVTVFLLNPNDRVALAAAEALASIGKVEPLWGMSLLPVVLYCVKYQGQNQSLAGSNVQLGLLKVFPSLAGHSTTLPLVLQALQPMLDSKADVALQATAIRILCKTWEFTDRAFPHLQKVLRPADIKEDLGKTELPLSRAACIRDVSKKDPDRGVDLVLSVQACIESSDPFVQSMGLQSLAFLCKEDVIDFYTAWLVISKFTPNFPSEPFVLQSLCLLLRHGALDAAAHPEAAADVLEILWKAATRKAATMEEEDAFLMTRATAFESLSSYEVEVLNTLFPSETRSEVELLFAERSPAVLPFLEDLLTKAIAYEYRERKRGQKETKVAVNKLGKLLKAFPETLNATGFAPTSGKRVTSISDFPGAALLCFSLPSPKKTGVSKMEFQKIMKIWQANHEKIFVEAAEQLYLGSSLVVAMLSLQSWCSFISRWLQTIFTIYDTESPNLGHEEKLLRSAKYLSKILQKTCEEGIPRVSESATLALAALCKVMPMQPHGISEGVSAFLELRLQQEGHEHIQWSATLALGVVASRLHATDWNHKYEITHRLLKYAGATDRGIVRGACGLALGIICQNLLSLDSSSTSGGVSRKREAELVVQIILGLSHLTSETCPPASPELKKFLGLLKTEVIAKERLASYVLPQGEKLEEEDFWAVVGLVWGLGSSVTVLQQLQCPTVLTGLTDLIVSWLFTFLEKYPIKDGGFECDALDSSQFFLAAGACLVLPICVEVSLRLEILKVEVNVLVEKIIQLIVYATNLSNTGGMEQWRSAFFVTLCVGAGNLIASVLKDGGQSVELEFIYRLAGAMQSGAENAGYGLWGHLGLMLGIANLLGGGAASVLPIKTEQLPESHLMSRVQDGRTDQATISRPLLHEAACEEYVSALIKKLLGVVRKEEDSRIRSYAGWALAFLNNSFFGDGEFGEMQGEEVSCGSKSRLLPKQSRYHMRSLQDFPEESPLRLLCNKVLSYEQKDWNSSAMNLQVLVSVLKCLEKAPRLPALDWGGLVRRLMRQNQTTGKDVDQEYLHRSSAIKGLTSAQIQVRQQCALFAFAHAEQIPALASFLDELSELPRLVTLEDSLRNLLMSHLSHLQRVFSSSRLKQLLQDVQDFVLNPTGLDGFLLEDKEQVEYQRQSFRMSVWNGLASCFNDADLGQHKEDDVVNCVEECMSVFINLLPTSIWSSTVATARDEASQVSEWSAAIKTLAKTNNSWLLQVLEVHGSDLSEIPEKIDSMSKAIFARCQLVLSGRLPPSELKNCRKWLMSRQASDVWRLLVEVTLAVKEAPFEDKREWLLDCLDTALISDFPTTALLLAALLASCWSILAPVLSLNPNCVIEDLPLTLPSLLTQSGWVSTAASVTSKLTSLLDRLGTQENKRWDDMVGKFEILMVVRRTCVGLKHYLPPETRLKIVTQF